MDPLQAGVCQVVVGAFVYVSLLLDLVVVGEAVHFVDEHFKVDVRVHLVGSGHGEVESTQRFYVVILNRKAGYRGDERAALYTR